MASLPTADQVYLALLDDSVPKIARQAGVSWETVWNHPQNAELRATRHPQVLRKGDRVFVPAPEQKQVDVAVGNRHYFTKLAAFETLRVQLLLDGAKRKPEFWRLEVEGCPPVQEDKGKRTGPDPTAAQFGARIDSGGLLVATIPGRADRAMLFMAWRGDQPDPFHAGPHEMAAASSTPRTAAIALQFRTLAPHGDPLGASQRLRNLGYDCQLCSRWSPGLDAALKAGAGDHVSRGDAIALIQGKHGS